MKVILTKDYEELSNVVLHQVLGHMLNSQHRVNMAITAGNSPKRLYQLLVDEVKEKNYYDNVHYYNFDEIPYKKKQQEGVTISELRQAYLDPAGIPNERIHALDAVNYAEQDKRIQQDGGLDVVLLGIGADGHFCGNLPGTTHFKDYTSKVICDQNMKEILAPIVGGMDEVPDYYVTMGPSSIMNVKHLILMINGASKAEITKKWFDSNIDESLPASILKTHPNLTVVIDSEAAQLL